MNEPYIELSGHLGADPTLRYTPNGFAVADLRLATTRRVKAGEGWEDGETIWFEVAVWKQLAENVSASVRKGDKVMVAGRLVQRTWVRDDGTSSTKLVIDATSVGVDLAKAPVKVLTPVREGSVVDVLRDRWAYEGGGLPPVSPELVEPELVEPEPEEQAA